MNNKNVNLKFKKNRWENFVVGVAKYTTQKYTTA